MNFSNEILKSIFHKADVSIRDAYTIMQATFVLGKSRQRHINVARVMNSGGRRGGKKLNPEFFCTVTNGSE